MLLDCDEHQESHMCFKWSTGRSICRIVSLTVPVWLCWYWQAPQGKMFCSDWFWLSFNVWRDIVDFSTHFSFGGLCGLCAKVWVLLGHCTVTFQGVLLAWTKHFKVRGVQDTDVVSSLRKALQKHKASFVPAGAEPEWPQNVRLGNQLLLCGFFWELSDILQGWSIASVQHGCTSGGSESLSQL